jgi:hypothetical protein
VPGLRARGPLSAPARPAGRRARGPLLGALFVTLTLGGTVGARVAAEGEVEEALRGAGFTWERRQDELGVARWEGLRRPGVSADHLTIHLIPPFRAELDGVDVQLDTLRGDGGAAAPMPSPAEAPGALDALVALELPLLAHGVRLRWGDDLLAEGLDGSLLPDLDLQGAGASLRRSAGAFEVELQRPLRLGPLSGAATLRAACAETCTLSLSVPEAELLHPLLADRALPAAPLLVDGTYDRASGALEGRVLFGGLTLAVAGTATLEPPAAALRFTLPPTPLSRVLDLMGPLVPEAKVADVRGTVSLEASFSHPSGAWTLAPAAEGLAAEGLLPDSSALRSGPLSWRAPSADGEGRLRDTGEGSPDWVPLSAAGLLPFAVMAAEDAGFRGHPGYDLRAVQEAIDAARAGEALRGGSTLTQQLAKNLFLDGGERTLARKLRELLYALEMEQALGKERILELYLNIVELGPDLYGVGPAADAFFAKRPERLSAREAAFIASILRSPRSGYTLAMSGGRTPNARIELILDNMVELHGISAAEGAMAKRGSLRFVPPLR